jgi:hypothetical protein
MLLHYLVNKYIQNNYYLIDAKDAIKHDPTYTKAYYRRGSAHLALNQLDLA